MTFMADKVLETHCKKLLHNLYVEITIIMAPVHLARIMAFSRKNHLIRKIFLDFRSIYEEKVN